MTPVNARTNNEGGQSSQIGSWTAVASELKAQHFADSAFYYSPFHFAAPKAEKACKPSVAGPLYGAADPAAQKTITQSCTRAVYCSAPTASFSAPLQNGCMQRAGGGGVEK